MVKNKCPVSETLCKIPSNIIAACLVGAAICGSAWLLVKAIQLLIGAF